MKVSIGIGGATLTREPGDKRIPKDSTVVFQMRNLLNAQGGHFVRIDPRRYGLTDCRLGLRDKAAGIILWHERYAIENAAERFNKDGAVFFQRVDEDVPQRCAWQTETGTVNSPKVCGKRAVDGYVCSSGHIQDARDNYPQLAIPKAGA